LQFSGDIQMVRIFVNNKAIEADPTVSLLHVLEKQGMEIPSLCFHPVLGGSGNCGLCIVEVCSQGNWKIQRACLLKPTEGMQIRLETPDVIRQRAIAARLLLHRGPFINKHFEKYLNDLISEALKNEFADDFKEKSDLKEIRGTLYQSLDIGCVLCGLCIRTCSKAGKGNLVFLGKGKKMRVGFVAHIEDYQDCGNCTACSHICPTGFIFSDARHAFQKGLYSDSN
jgi:NADH dehydrogenase/NADH:ubiquinone oxidoreductase subunit G